jgi:hypothetical protein
LNWIDGLEKLNVLGKTELGCLPCCPILMALAVSNFGVVGCKDKDEPVCENATFAASPKI